MEQLIGFLLGILGSFLFWWLFAHWLVPDVEFEDSILVRDSRDGSGRPRYMIKFYNRGRRDLIEVSLIAIVQIQTKSDSDVHWASCPLAFHRDGSTEHAIPVVPPGRNRLITLHAGHSARIGFEGAFSDSVRTKLASGTLDLPDLLADGEGRGLAVRLQISLFGYDRFSGAKKLYQSKFYRLADIQPKPDDLQADR